MINITNKWKSNQVRINWETINIYKINNNNYLTKKDISKLFNTKKSIIKSIIKELNINEFNRVYSKEKQKFINTYSIEKIIIIWYKLKKFNETKNIIKINRIIKNNSNNSTNLFDYTLSLFSKIKKEAF